MKLDFLTVVICIIAGIIGWHLGDYKLVPRIGAAEWKEANRLCANRGGALYLLRPEQTGHNYLTAVCNESEVIPFEK